MNRRKFLGVCAGAAVVGVAASKVVVEPETIGFAPRHYPYQKLRWVNSDQLYNRMRAGWREYQDPIDGTLFSKLVAHNKIAHLMVFNG